MPQQKEVVEGKLNGEGSMDTQAILITANTNSSHMLSRLPEQIRLASAITPHRSQFIGKNEKKTLHRVCTGWTWVGAAEWLPPARCSSEDGHTSTAGAQCSSRALAFNQGLKENRREDCFFQFHSGKLACSKGNVRQAQLQADRASGIPHTYQHMHGERTQYANTLKSQINISKISCAPGERRGLPTHRIKKLISV